MKKILSLLCAASLVLCFAACTKKTEEVKNDSADDVQEEITESADTPAIDEDEKTSVEDTSEDTSETSEDSAETSADITEKTEDETPEEIDVTRTFDPEGLDFVGYWVNDTGTPAMARIASTGPNLFTVVARIYRGVSEYDQYEIEALHTVTDDGTSTLVATSYELFHILENIDGTIEIMKQSPDFDNVHLVYDNSNQVEYVTWFFTEGDIEIVTFIRAYSLDNDLLMVEQMRN